MDPRDDVLPEAFAREILAAVSEHVERQPAAQLRGRVLAAARREGAAFVVVRANEGAWRPIAPGVSAKVLYDDGVSRTWLARMLAGSSLPPHSHPADEECMVLEGDLEADGVAVAAGDYQVALRGSRHGTVSTRAGCLLLLRTASC